MKSSCKTKEQNSVTQLWVKVGLVVVYVVLYVFIYY